MIHAFLIKNPHSSLQSIASNTKIYYGNSIPDMFIDVPAALESRRQGEPEKRKS